MYHKNCQICVRPFKTLRLNNFKNHFKRELKFYASYKVIEHRDTYYIFTDDGIDLLQIALINQVIQLIKQVSNVYVVRQVDQ